MAVAVESLSDHPLAGAIVRDLAERVADGDALVTALLAGPTNAGVAGRIVRETLSLADYAAFFDALPAPVRAAVSDRWGAPEADPFFLPGRLAFALPLLMLMVVLILEK